MTFATVFFFQLKVERGQDMTFATVFLSLVQSRSPKHKNTPGLMGVIVAFKVSVIISRWVKAKSRGGLLMLPKADSPENENIYIGSRGYKFNSICTQFVWGVGCLRSISLVYVAAEGRGVLGLQK